MTIPSTGTTDPLIRRPFRCGSAPSSYRMEKDAITGILWDPGLNVTVGDDAPDHPNDPLR